MSESYWSNFCSGAFEPATTACCTAISPDGDITTQLQPLVSNAKGMAANHFRAEILERESCVTTVMRFPYAWVAPHYSGQFVQWALHCNIGMALSSRGIA